MIRAQNIMWFSIAAAVLVVATAVAFPPAEGSALQYGLLMAFCALFFCATGCALLAAMKPGAVVARVVAISLMALLVVAYLVR